MCSNIKIMLTNEMCLSLEEEEDDGSFRDILQ